MLNEIDQLINSLKSEGHIKNDMTQMEVVKLVYSLMFASSRANVSSTLATWQRCAFVRRHIANVIGTKNQPETLDMLKKNGMVSAMAKHFQISESHAYSVCNTCIQMIKNEFKIR